MTTKPLNAPSYYSTRAESFWQWSPNGQEIAWRDGPTIAFLSELSSVFYRLAEDGLPPFGAILLLLAAGRNNWSEPPDRRGILAAVLSDDPAKGAPLLLQSVCDGLDQVHRLPPDLRQSQIAKAELAAMVFEGASDRLPRSVSLEIANSLAHIWAGGSFTIDANTTAQMKWAESQLIRDLGTLHRGLQRVSEQALRLRLQTSFEAMPLPAPIETPPLTGRAWLKWLEQQEEFAAVARLAQRLLAVIHLPRPLHQPEELPLGGITDIAPRGPLDRLLLSELAHDDLTLAVRVAMNEALYLRRETPPASLPRQRHVLLDSGLRSWGLPRLYGTAVALALATRHEADVSVHVHRAGGETLAAVDLNSVEGLREHLAALDHRLHPGDVLPAWSELLGQGERDDGVIVVSQETLADPKFRQALESNLAGTCYLATVARDGRFELLRHSRAGRKSLSRAQLPLEQILVSGSKAPSLRNAARGQLPAIFAARPFPLLLSAAVLAENSWHVPKLGLLTLTRQGQLLCWAGPAIGAKQLALGLPEGSIFGAKLANANSKEICLVVGRLGPTALHAVWLESNGGVQRVVPLRPEVPSISSVAVDQQFVYVTSKSTLVSMNLESGECVGRLRLSSGQTTQGVFLAEAPTGRTGRDSQWWRMSSHADVLQLVPINTLNNSHNRIVAMLEAHNTAEGPLGITRSGQILLPATGGIRPVSHGLQSPTIGMISRDGMRFSLHSGSQRVVVFSSNGAVAACSRHTEAAMVEPGIFANAKPRTLRRRFLGLGIDALGQLVLVTPKRTAWTLDRHKLEFPRGSRAALVDLPWRPFEDWPHEASEGLVLRKVEFPDGSTAVLDNRGLIHLRSSNASIPECTIVLVEGATAGWCADGRMWGPKYYLDAQPATLPGVIAREVINPFLELAR